MRENIRTMRLKEGGRSLWKIRWTKRDSLAILLEVWTDMVSARI